MGYQTSLQPTDDISTNKVSLPAREQDMDSVAGVFDFISFNESTQINVSRSVLVNDWAYLTIIDTVTILNSTTKNFNSFEYTITDEFYDLVEYFEIKIVEGAENDVNYTTARDNSTGTTTMTALIPNVPFFVNESYVFQVILGISDAVTQINDELPDIASGNTTALPFQLSGVNFYPWFNFPITNLEVKTGINSLVASQNNNLFFSNTTALPKPIDVNAEFSTVETPRSFQGIYVPTSDP